MTSHRVPLKEWKESRSTILSLLPWKQGVFASTGNSYCFDLKGTKNKNSRFCKHNEPSHWICFLMCSGPEVIKLFHEILNAHKNENIKKIGFFLGSDKPRMIFFPLINVKMPTIVGILTVMSRKNFMLS